MAPRNVMDDALHPLEIKQEAVKPKRPYRASIVWVNVGYFLLAHAIAGIGVYQGIFYAKWPTIVFSIFMYWFAGLGITAGAHRLWAHKAYKARWPLRLFLMIANTTAFQNSIYDWCRDHRVHHKYSETNADPHNAKRGAFFSHMGWLLVRKHPSVIEKGSQIDLSDLVNDPIVAFQRRHYIPLMLSLTFIVPSLIPWLLWQETFFNSYAINITRWIFLLHGTWLVNSAAHLWGYKPYDITINPSENNAVAFVALGEGWHNYHHAFPRDYKTAELGDYSLNLTTAFIDLMAKIGLSYDLNSVSAEQISRRIERTGPNSGIQTATEDDSPKEY